MINIIWCVQLLHTSFQYYTRCHTKRKYFNKGIGVYSTIESPLNFTKQFKLRHNEWDGRTNNYKKISY
jgi:hypothetical protein